MKKLIAVITLVLGVTFATSVQDVKKVALEQTKGEFTQQSITLKPGNYVFEITNSDAGVDVGFVLVPKGKDASDPKNHIQNAYVTKVVTEGKTESSKEVKLEKGTYTYFCPLNKTPQYDLVVQ